MEYTEQQVVGWAREGYERGDAEFAIVPERSALLVIDMQDEWVKPGWTPYWVPEATRRAPAMRRLVDFCRERGLPVIHTAFGRTHQYLDRPLTGSAMPNRLSHLNVDQSGLFVEARFWHELTPRPDEIVILKPSYGAFYDTPLETILRNLGRDTVIITGTMTNYCCGLTARQAYERGFKVVFGSDLTATDDPDLQEAELKVLRRGFARVLSLDQILAALD
jgi:nicotinamidase-related amidase